MTTFLDPEAVLAIRRKVQTDRGLKKLPDATHGDVVARVEAEELLAARRQVQTDRGLKKLPDATSAQVQAVLTWRREIAVEVAAHDPLLVAEDTGGSPSPDPDPEPREAPEPIDAREENKGEVGREDAFDAAVTAWKEPHEGFVSRQEMRQQHRRRDAKPRPYAPRATKTRVIRPKRVRPATSGSTKHRYTYSGKPFDSLDDRPSGMSLRRAERVRDRFREEARAAREVRSIEDRPGRIVKKQPYGRILRTFRGFRMVGAGIDLVPFAVVIHSTRGVRTERG